MPRTELADGELILITPGKSPDVDINNAMVGDPVITRTIDGASTVEIPVADHQRRLLTSSTITERAFLTVAGINFEFVQLKKSGPLLTLVFEDAIAGALRRQTEKLTVPAGTITRAELAQRLAREPRAKIPVEVDPANRGPIRNATARKDSDSWTLLGEIADEVDWRRFSTGTTLIVGSDEWLLERKEPITMREHAGAVVTPIDFDLDVGKRASEASLSVDASLFGLAPGDPALLEDMGPADGKWLVAEVARAVRSTRAGVRLVRGRHSLKEPKRESNGTDTGDPDFVPTPDGTAPAPADVAGSSARERMVQFALAQAGDAYVWGGNGPDGWDCSGLVQAATAAAGRQLTKPSASQWSTCVAAGKTISVASALGIRGALLFRIGGTYNHIAISLGNGSTIEARGTAYGTGVFGGASGGGWTGAALWI